MGLIIEKEKSKEGEDQDDADKDERDEDEDDREKKKDGRKKRRKKAKTSDKEKLDEGGTSAEIQDEDENLTGEKRIRGKSKLLKDYWKTSPRESDVSIPTPKEECRPDEGIGVDTRMELESGYDLRGEQKLGKAVKKSGRVSEKSKDCRICHVSCCLRVKDDLDDIQDEKGMEERKVKKAVGETITRDESHLSGNEVYQEDGSTMEIEPESKEEKNICRQPVLKGSRRLHEFPAGSPFSVRRYHEKKSRFQSSRPTSLETIIEDVTSSPFFFQDSIMQSFDGREDHRGIRESATLFQVSSEEERDDKKGHMDYFEDRNNFGRWEGSSEEDLLEDDINTLPLRSSRIFRGVIENLNYIFESGGEGDGTFTPEATNFLFQELVGEDLHGKRDSISSSSSSKCDYGMEERLRDISENEEEEEEDEDNKLARWTSDCSFPAPEHIKSVTEAFMQKHPFQKQFRGRSDNENPVTTAGISQCYRDSFSSSEELRGNLSLSELGCERPQVLMAEEEGEEEDESLKRFYFLKDISGGSDIEGSCYENLSDSEMTSRIESIDSSICNIDIGGLTSGRPFDPREISDASSPSLEGMKAKDAGVSLGTLGRAKTDSRNESEKSSEKVSGETEIADEASGAVEENISSFEVRKIIETGGDSLDKKENINICDVRYTNKTVISSVADLQKKSYKETPRLATGSFGKVSFTVYIQYETISTEIIPKDIEPERKAEMHPDMLRETQLAVATPIRETIESESSLLLQEDLGKNYQLKLLKAIQSLDSLNDQIVEFIFSGAEFEEEHGGSPKQREALKSSMSLMRRLLVDAQSKFRKMVEDNKQLASRIDGELQTAHQEVNLLRQELADTNRRITQIQEHNHHNMDDSQRPQEGGVGEGVPPRPDTPTTTINGPNKYHSESSSNQLAEEMSHLRLENEKLSARNRSLQREVEELRRVKESMVEEDLQLKPQINQMTMELTHAKEALSALKADRKRLKAEKFDLLNQMKQLYATLEDKEKELRDFIRNYEQRMKESDESLRHLAAERDETEREKWNILKHARDESEKVVKLSAQLGLKEAEIKKLHEDLEMVRKQLTSVGYYSDAESVRTNGLPTPTASTPTCSPQPVSTPTPTPNGRGSSADSGVRLSSDRDSTASHDGTPTITVEHGSFDCDTLSVCSSATAASLYYHACGMGTPKESPSLSPLYATPSSIRDDRGGDSTPTGGPMPSGPSLNSSAMSGLASSNASSGGLSRSAEQLCERLAEANDTSKVRGSNTLSRKSNKSGGTWGSISRVFARQKKRAALDASLYDGNGSDKRASWSPSSSLCVSPLTEESYSEKLRLLEEAQHIPLERWKAPTVLAWLEVTLGMPQYGAMCAENVRSGKVLLELNDSELEAGLGISHPMHRKKLRLAIEELREPRLSRYPRISALGHTWVSSEWLPDLGLPQYCDAFANNLVDGRLLEALTKKELEKHLGVHRKFHQASIIHGVHLLRIVRFDRQILAERRRQSENVDCDPIVWTNIRWVKWARTIDLAEYADNLKDSGVHGALVVLESSFTADTMATALGIPQSKNIIRRHLATELESLVNPARQQLDEQARYAKLERRRQEKLAAGGSLGRSFSRSYGTGLERAEKDKRRASLRGSLSRALGLRVREEFNAAGNGGESSSSGGQSPAVSSRAHPHHPPQTRPRSSVMPSGVYVHHETHRRVKSIGDIETITVTPV